MKQPRLMIDRQCASVYMSLPVRHLHIYMKVKVYVSFVSKKVYVSFVSNYHLVVRNSLNLRTPNLHEYFFFMNGLLFFTFCFLARLFLFCLFVFFLFCLLFVFPCFCKLACRDHLSVTRPSICLSVFMYLFI